jgi:hypothetical protein
LTSGATFGAAIATDPDLRPHVRFASTGLYLHSDCL